MISEHPPGVVALSCGFASELLETKGGFVGELRPSAKLSRPLREFQLVISSSSVAAKAIQMCLRDGSVRE